MVRRGRSASPPPATRRSVPHAPRPAPTSNLPKRAAPAAPPPAPVHAAPSAVSAPPQKPSMFKDMAATAGGVAVGSAVGHVVGAGLTGLFSGSGDRGVAVPDAASPQAASQYYSQSSQPNEPEGICSWEIKEFLQCAQAQSDLTLCEGFNEALRQCKQKHNMQ